MLFWTTKRVKGKQVLYYNIIKYNHKGYFNIYNDISEHVTLVQLMDYLGNVNCVISVVGYWIFDSNYDNTIMLDRSSLDIICAPSVG